MIPDNTFDIVIGTQVFCCINNMTCAVREIYRVLKPKGALFFLENVQYEEGSLKHFIQKIYSISYKGYSLRCHAGELVVKLGDGPLTSFSLGCFDVETLLESAGFEVTNRFTNINPCLPLALSRFDYGYAIKV